MNVIVGDLILGVDCDGESLDRSQVQVGHFFHVANRSFDLLEVVLISEKSDGEYRDCYGECIKRDDSYELDDQASGDSTCEIRHPNPQKRLAPDRYYISAGSQGAHYADDAGIQRVMNQSHRLGGEDQTADV